MKNRTLLVSMDITSLYTNIIQNEGIEIVCKAYKNFYKDNPPIPYTLPACEPSDVFTVVASLPPKNNDGLPDALAG